MNRQWDGEFSPSFYMLRGAKLKKGKIPAIQLQCLFVLFHAAAVAYAVLFLHPYYGSNDEFSLAAIASGAYGDYTHYFIYLHSGFAWILKAFYMCMPDVNWYTIVMYGLIFLSLTTVGCTWIRCSEKTGTILSVMLTLACVCPFSAAGKLDSFPGLWHGQPDCIRVMAVTGIECIQGKGVEEISALGLHSLRGGVCSCFWKHCHGKRAGLYPRKP